MILFALKPNFLGESDLRQRLWSLGKIHAGKGTKKPSAKSGFTNEHYGYMRLYVSFLREGLK